MQQHSPTQHERERYPSTALAATVAASALYVPGRISLDTAQRMVQVGPSSGEPHSALAGSSAPGSTLPESGDAPALDNRARELELNTLKAAARAPRHVRPLPPASYVNTQETGHMGSSFTGGPGSGPGARGPNNSAGPLNANMSFGGPSQLNNQQLSQGLPSIPWLNAQQGQGAVPSAMVPAAARGIPRHSGLGGGGGRLSMEGSVPFAHQRSSAVAAGGGHSSSTKGRRRLSQAAAIVVVDMGVWELCAGSNAEFNDVTQLLVPGLEERARFFPALEGALQVRPCTWGFPSPAVHSVLAAGLSVPQMVWRFEPLAVLGKVCLGLHLSCCFKRCPCCRPPLGTSKPLQPA